MAVELIDTIFDIPAIQAQIAAFKTGVADCQDGIEGLYSTIKSFKDTGISNLAANTDKLNTSITGSVAATQKAKQAFDELTNRISAQIAVANDNASAMNKGAQAYDTLIKQAVKNKVALDDLSASQMQLKKSMQAGTVSLQEYETATADIVTAQQSLKTANQDVTRTITQMSKEAQAATGSLDQVRAKLGQLIAQYDRLSEAERSTDGGQNLQKTIQTLDQLKKSLEGTTGRFGGNVGNYTGAFGEAFKVLQNELKSAQAQAAQMEQRGQQGFKNYGAAPIGFNNQQWKTSPIKGPSGQVANILESDAAAYQQVVQRANLLETELKRVNVGFKTTRQEARAFQEAAVNLGLSIGQESEEFMVFDAAVGHTQEGINKIKAATKFQSTDLKLLHGLAQGATAIAGAFGAAQAGAALFAGEDDNLQKQMAKFQELLVLINGLQMIANGLQAESGAMQLLLEAKTRLLNAAKAVQLLVTTRAVQIVGAETVADMANADAQETQTVATTEQAVAEEAKAAATVESTAATAANTAAAGKAAKGIGALGTAFVAAGIAALAIAAGAGLALLTAKLIGFGNATGPSVDQMKDIASATKELNDALEGEAKIFDELDDSQRRYYTNLIENAKAAGASQYAILLAQQRSDKAEAERAQQEVDRLGATDAAYSKQAQKVQQLHALRALASEEIIDLSNIPESKQTWHQKNTLSRDQRLVAVYNSQLDEANGVFDKMTAARAKS